MWPTSLISFGLFLLKVHLRELYVVNRKKRNTSWIPFQDMLDVKTCLSVLPRFQFSIHLITQTLLLPDVLSRYSGLTVH